MSATKDQMLIGCEVWIVGQTVWRAGAAEAYPDWPDWEFQGVFSSRDAAIAACRDHMYFVFPAKIGESFPHESVQLEGCFYPLSEPAGGV